MTIKTK